MFIQVSWSSYITIVVVLLVIYYVIILFRFYRDDLLQLLSGRNITLDNKEAFTPIQKQPFNNQEKVLQKVDLEKSFEKLNLFQLTQALSDEIQAFLNEARRHSLNKEDIIQSLKLLITKYPSIKDSAFHPVINNLIKTECETNCSIHLSEEELSGLW